MRMLPSSPNTRGALSGAMKRPLIARVEMAEIAAVELTIIHKLGAECQKWFLSRTK